MMASFDISMAGTLESKRTPFKQIGAIRAGLTLT